MFENRVIDQTISERGKELPGRKKQVPQVMPETDDDQEETEFVN
jgi:hypothetical protein